MSTSNTPSRIRRVTAFGLVLAALLTSCAAHGSTEDRQAAMEQKREQTRSMLLATTAPPLGPLTQCAWDYSWCMVDNPGQEQECTNEAAECGLFLGAYLPATEECAIDLALCFTSHLSNFLDCLRERCDTP